MPVTISTAFLLLGIVLLIECVSAFREVVFQRRLIEILDRFLSRSLSDYAASQATLGKQIVEQMNDWDTALDLESLHEASSALRHPDQPREPAEVA